MMNINEVQGNPPYYQAPRKSIQSFINSFSYNKPQSSYFSPRNYPQFHNFLSPRRSIKQPIVSQSINIIPQAHRQNHQYSVEVPHYRHSKKPQINEYIVENRSKPIKFTYCTPHSLRATFLKQDLKHIHPLSEFHSQQHHHHSSNQQTNTKLTKVKINKKLQFPYSTESTLPTLKDTKGKDLNYFEIVNEKKKVLLNESFDQQVKDECRIQLQLDDLFMNEKQEQEQNEQQFEFRQVQFGQLFS